MKKLIGFLIKSLILIIGVLTFVMQVNAAECALKLSKSSVVVGEKITVTISVPEGTNAQIDLRYPTDILQYEEADTLVGEPVGGVITMTVGTLVDVPSVTLTFKAKTSGEGTIESVVTYAFDDDEQVINLQGKSEKITVENKSAEVTKSDDNSLQYIKLSSGTLSPAFVYNVTSYTATVDYSVTSLVIDAKTSNAKATIESVTGNENLQVGENTIKIVVVAENGTKATYKIVVTRLPKPDDGNNGGNSGGNNGESSGGNESNNDSGSSENEPEKEGVKFSYGSQELVTKDEIPAEIIPKNFTESTQVIGGKEIGVLKADDGDLTVLYLENAEGYGALYIYDEVEKDVYPFIKLEAAYSYIIVLRPSVESSMEDAQQCTISIEGKGTVIGYQRAEDIYLLYCMNDDGEKGWYLYDTYEQTFLRNVSLNADEENDNNNDNSDQTVQGNTEDKDSIIASLKSSQKRMQLVIYALASAVAVLLVALIIVTIVGLKSTKIEDDEDETEIGEDELRNSSYDKPLTEEGKKSSGAKKVIEEDNTSETKKVAEQSNATETIQTLDETKKDDFDVEVSLNDTFPEDEGDYEDEDLELLDL